MRAWTLLLALSTLPALSQTATSALSKARNALLEETIIHPEFRSFEAGHVDRVETYVMRYRADMSADPRTQSAR